MKMPRQRFAGVVNTRGMTLPELLVVVTVALCLLAGALPLIASAHRESSEAISMNNLAILGQAHDCYAGDWNDRQVTWIPDDYGEVNNCSGYLYERRCIEGMILGWANFSGARALWGYWIDSGGQCEGVGSCANVMLALPIDFTSSIGSFRIPNGKAFQQYVGEAFYTATWYAPGDPAHGRASRYFGVEDEFNSANNGEVTWPSYVLSPAAMLHPDVPRAPSAGGYQDAFDFPDYYRSPTVKTCVYPELKTRMIEHNWFRDPPSPFNPYFGGGSTPWMFNQGLMARPYTLFFDGSVSSLPTIKAWADDLIVQAGTKGVDGLWSRDTPLGPDGYYGAQSYEGLAINHHILTTDGIRGRDILDRQGGRP